MDTNEMNSPQIEHEQNSIDLRDKKNDTGIKTATEQVRRPMDYIRKEAVMRLRNLENKKKIEIQILKTQLEAGQIKKGQRFHKKRPTNVCSKKPK